MTELRKFAQLVDEEQRLDSDEEELDENGFPKKKKDSADEDGEDVTDEDKLDKEDEEDDDDDDEAVAKHK